MDPRGRLAEAVGTEPAIRVVSGLRRLMVVKRWTRPFLWEDNDNNLR
jgi:hypothetical protein